MILIVLSAAVLLPSFHLWGWNLALRFEVVAAAILLTCWAATSVLRGRLRIVEEARWLAWFAGLLSLVLLSVLVAIAFLDYAPSTRDVSELLRIIAYGALFWLGVRFGKKRPRPSAVTGCLLGAGTVAVLIGILQYFNALGINSWLTPLYATTQLRGVVVQQRIIGTFSNPNEFGAFLVLPAAVSLATSVLSSRRHHRVFGWLLLALFGIGITLTGSRTALAALLIMIAATFVFTLPRLLRGAKTLKVALLMLVVAALSTLSIAVIGPGPSVARLAQIGDLRQASSWQARLEDWVDDYRLWLASPVTGWGPGEADMETTVDNEWLLIMRRYGIFGLVWFVVGGVGVFAALRRLLGKSRAPRGKILIAALVGVLPAYAFYMFFAAVYHAPQLMPPLLLVLGAALAASNPAGREVVGDASCA